ncbi:hypothetical protein KPHES18084_12070 [Corynebacterium ulcerans]|nr:hypothetical protein CULTSU28_13120 [Corynebacterium ulcerans]
MWARRKNIEAPVISLAPLHNEDLLISHFVCPALVSTLLIELFYKLTCKIRYDGES